MIFDLFRKERRRVITTSAELAEYIAANGGEASSGISVTPATAFRHGPVYACVKVLGESVGMLPCHLYEQRGKSKDKASKHPLYRLIHSAPNAFQTAQEFWEMCVVHQALHGNFYAYINRGAAKKKVLELLPLQPTAVTPKYLEDSDGGRVVYKVKYANGSEAVLESSEVLHIKAFTLDGLCGVSAIQYAKESFGTNMAVEKHAGKLFSNGANPGGVLTTDKPWNDKQYDEMKKSWDERHQGAENAHRTAILMGGLKWMQVGLSSEDAQLIEARKYGRTEICGLFRVPPSMIADLERATFSNSEQQARSFVDYSLMPYLTRIEQRINLQLLTEAEQETHFAKFNVGALLRGDMQSRAEFYTRQVQNGALSPNEIRELEDLNPREDGDIYLVPSNMLINGELPALPGGTDPKPPQPPPEEQQ